MQNIKLFSIGSTLRVLAGLLTLFPVFLILPAPKDLLARNDWVGDWLKGMTFWTLPFLLVSCLLAAIAAWRLSEFMAITGKISAENAKQLQMVGSLLGWSAAVFLAGRLVPTLFATLSTQGNASPVKIGGIIGASLVWLIGASIKRIGSILQAHVTYREELEGFI